MILKTSFACFSIKSRNEEIVFRVSKVVQVSTGCSFKNTLTSIWSKIMKRHITLQRQSICQLSFILGDAQNASIIFPHLKAYSLFVSVFPDWPPLMPSLERYISYWWWLTQRLKGVWDLSKLLVKALKHSIRINLWTKKWPVRKLWCMDVLVVTVVSSKYYE